MKSRKKTTKKGEKGTCVDYLRWEARDPNLSKKRKAEKKIDEDQVGKSDSGKRKEKGKSILSKKTQFRE